ncbi:MULTISPECIES: DUF1127 domain-containing protein [unclassified Lentilitoribacter]|jgi:uncharacterized protein YjiS (DUF1127 family)|nr:DUF1127 domain-containing protein [Lentilitoribacter sp. Alg239-R112]
MNILNKVRNWKQQRETRNLLNGMTPRQLDDIGLTRSGIEAVVRNPHNA